MIVNPTNEVLAVRLRRPDSMYKGIANKTILCTLLYGTFEANVLRVIEP